MIALEIILALVSAMFVYVGLLAFGTWIFKWRKLGNGSVHEKVAFGFGLFYVLYHLFHVVLEPKQIWIAITIVFSICIFSERRSLVVKLRKINPRNKFLWLVFLILTPFIFRLISPPISDDGLSFYLPQVAWLYEYGLIFNPFLTQYTTMPQGIQILFTLPFGVSGYSGVRFLDAFGALGLLHLIYAESKNLLNEKYSKIFVLIALFLKGTILFLFGTGKIDTWNAYILATGIFAFFKAVNSKNFQNVFIIFSIALTLKYTNWVMLVLPLLLGGYFLFCEKPFLQWIVLMLLPVLFSGSVLIRNQYQVNNTLAPFFSNGSESRYVHNHGPILYENYMDGTPYSSKYNFVNLTLKFLLHPIFIVTFFIGLLIIFRFREMKFSNQVSHAGLLLMLMLVPWLGIFGFSAQPMRFIWPIVLLALIIALLVIKDIQSVRSYPKIYAQIFTGFLGLILLFLAHSKGRNYIFNFFELPNKRLSEWYAHVGKHHYAMSYHIKELGLHHQNIFYEAGVALGAFDVHEYGCFPNQNEFFNRNKGEWSGYDYLLLKGHEKMQLFQKEKVALQYGDYYLIQLKK